MRLTSMPTEFSEAIPIIQELAVAGYEAYFVGGSVRDVLLGKAINDVDIATSAYPKEVKSLFKRTVDVGIEHGTVLVLHEDQQYEITTFRTESQYQDFRRPDKVTFVRSLEEDLKRRDFTINALAMSEQGQIIDLFEGLKDIQKKCIRAVGQPSERFHEDALRMMRALRFSSQLDFLIEKNTLDAIKEHAALLQKISVERIYIELIKMMTSRQWKRGFRSFLETKCYEYCPNFSGRGKQLACFLQLKEETELSEPVFWVLLMHFFTLNAEKASSFLRDWKLSNHMIRLITHALAGLEFRLENSSNVDFLYQLGLEPLLVIEEVLALLGKPSSKQKVTDAYQALPIHSLQDLAVNGQAIMRVLDKKPGPWLGDLLKEIEQKVLHKELENSYEKIVNFIQECALI